MVEENGGNEQNHTFPYVWARLTDSQRRFAVAMLDHKTKKDAAEFVGLNPHSVYAWGPDVDEAIDIMRRDAAAAAVDMLAGAVVKATMIKLAGLDSDDERLRQSVASEIQDRIMGKPKQSIENTGKDGGPIRIESVKIGGLDVDKI